VTAAERVIWPRRVVRCRDNWFVYAYCHLRERISTFSMDDIVKARMSKAAALEIEDADLDYILAGGFGIFSGKPIALVVLRFLETINRWASAGFFQVCYSKDGGDRPAAHQIRV
jgi:predicted DNA-binding transcriptional regulator YafY